VEAILTAELQKLPSGKFIGFLGGLFSDRQFADFVIGKMNDALKEWGLVR